MDNRNQFTKYTKILKKYCKVQIVACAVTFVALIFILFLPNFYINLADVSFSDTTLPKFHELSMEDLLTDNPRITFSIFDEIYGVINPVREGLDEASATLASSFSFLQIIGAIFLGVGLLISAVSFVRHIYFISSMENFAIETFDNIKRRSIGRKNRWNYLLSPGYWIIIGIVYEVIAIYFSVMMAEGIPSAGNVLTSYFAVFSGLTAGGVITLLIAIAAIAVFIYGVMIRRKITTDMLRDEYLATPASTGNNEIL